MRTLRKIQLKEATVIPDGEMRQIRGGVMSTTPTIANCSEHNESTGCLTDARPCKTATGEGKCFWQTGINKCTCV